MEDEFILLSRARALDQEALTQIHDRYYTRVFRYIDYRVQDVQSVEDLTSEVFIRFLNAIRDHHAPQNTLEGWLIGVAKNVVREHYRQSRKNDWIPLAEDEASQSPTPPEVADSKLMQEQLKEAMAGLTADQQQVLALRFGFEMPVKQVAETMQKSEGSIKMLQARAVSSLTRMLRGSEVGT